MTITTKMILSESRAGFEPANQGFADPAIRPLWYRDISLHYTTKIMTQCTNFRAILLLSTASHFLFFCSIICTMTRKVTIGVDARLCGTKNAGLGRHILNLCLRLPFYAPPEFQFVYFFADKTQWSEVIAHLSELTLPAGTNADTYLSRIKICIAPITHYTFAEQKDLPKVFAAENLDILHVPHFNLPLLAKAPRIIVTIHDLLWHEKKGPAATTLPAWKYFFKYQGYKLITAHAAKAAQAIITPSQHIRETVSQYYPAASDKIQVVYNGVSNFPTSTCAPFTIKIPNDYLLYVGSLYPHKNVTLILQALAQNRDLRLVIVSARDVFWEKTQAEITKNHLESQVTFLPGVNDCQLRYLYEHAAALVQPSLSEGFGLTGVESMRCGCLVMASDIPIFREIYADHFLPFDPHDVTAFLQLILSLARYRQADFLQAAYDFSLRYNWDQMTLQTLEIYQKQAASLPPLPSGAPERTA